MLMCGVVCHHYRGAIASLCRSLTEADACDYCKKLMQKDHATRSYTAEDLKAMRRRGEDRTDWAKVDAMTEADLERTIAEHEDERDLEPDWTRAELVLSRPRQSVHLRLEPEVVDFFKADGKGHITRMQAVLRAYVDAQKRRREASRD